MRPMKSASPARSDWIVATLFLFMLSHAAASYAVTELLHWEKLIPLPDAVGVAGPFAGTSGGALIVAGGANFPEAMPWEGGKKAWHDEAYVLPSPNAAWQSGFKLPKPNAYGVSVTTDAGIVCLGGGNAQENFSDVFLLKWKSGKFVTEILPSLPRPTAFATGALLDHVIYIAGGLETPNATQTLHTFWALDLKQRKRVWQELEPWPGPSRMLAVAAVFEGSFFLLSGVDLQTNGSGKTTRIYLKDAFRYAPKKVWKRIADLPRPAAAAPSPAPLIKERILIISGDDGALVDFEPKSQHPGFPRDVLSYNPRNDTWEMIERSPLSRATVPVVKWQKQFVIPNGEVRPGRRTPEIWTLSGSK